MADDTRTGDEPNPDDISVSPEVDEEPVVAIADGSSNT